MRLRCVGATLLTIALGAALGCTGDTPPAPTSEPASTPEPRQLSDPAPNRDGVLRVLVLHDMEGLSGQRDPDTFSFRHSEKYRLGRQYLVGDVNAVIAGLFDGGADEVHVVDGHGSGNPDPDLLLDELDPRAQMVFRDAPFRQYVDLVEPDVYDAVAVVGMHAKTGSGGFASHTFTLGMDIIMNGMSITETELVAYSFGRVGVPVIFASGDDRLGRDLETMPWIEYVTVKRALGADDAEPREVDEVRAELRSKAGRALSRRDESRAMTLGTPITAALRTVPPASLEVLDGVPGIDYGRGTVTFVADDFQQAYDGVIRLIGVARTAYQSVLLEAIDARPDGDALRRAYADRLSARWFDVESGRWVPPAQEPEPPRRYHGAR